MFPRNLVFPETFTKNLKKWNENKNRDEAIIGHCLSNKIYYYLNTLLPMVIIAWKPNNYKDD